MSLSLVPSSAGAAAEQQLQQAAEVQRLEKRVKSLVLSLARADRENTKLKAELGRAEAENSELADRARTGRVAPEESFLSRPPESPQAIVRRDIELATMKVSALRKRAAAVGVDSDAVDEAGDSDRPKEALTALIVAAEGPMVGDERSEWLDTRLFNSVDTGSQAAPEVAAVGAQARPEMAGVFVQADREDPAV